VSNATAVCQSGRDSGRGVDRAGLLSRTVSAPRRAGVEGITMIDEKQRKGAEAQFKKKSAPPKAPRPCPNTRPRVISPQPVDTHRKHDDEVAGQGRKLLRREMEETRV
jgi:hypothetical protein